MNKNCFGWQSLSEKTRIIFLSAPPVNEEQICETLRCLCCKLCISFRSCGNYSVLIEHVFIENSITLGELRRTDESCRIYSEACLELCREMDIKAIDLWTAIQKRDDWLTTSFT
jgi:hypothetical protein